MLAKLSSRLQRALTILCIPSHSHEDAPPALFCSGLIMAAGGHLRRAHDAALPSPGDLFLRLLTFEALRTCMGAGMVITARSDLLLAMRMAVERLQAGEGSCALGILCQGAHHAHAQLLAGHTGEDAFQIPEGLLAAITGPNAAAGYRFEAAQAARAALPAPASLDHPARVISDSGDELP